jgi:hypothetical protein
VGVLAHLIRVQLARDGVVGLGVCVLADQGGQLRVVLLVVLGPDLGADKDVRQDVSVKRAHPGVRASLRVVSSMMGLPGRP